MSVDIDGYLTLLGMGDTFKQRAKEIVGWHEALCNEAMEDVFVGEYLEQSGERRFERIISFGDSMLLEVADFLEVPTLWIAPLRPPMTSIEIKFADYDFSAAIPASRLSCVCRWEPARFVLDLKASGENCDKLRELLTSRLTSPWKAGERDASAA